LGAGDYSNAIANKRRFPNARVVATNSYQEWFLGRELVKGGIEDMTNDFVKIYKGWEQAQREGVETGPNDTRIYQNEDLIGKVAADIVYAIAPPPSMASLFGVAAARIAKTEPGTIVAATEGASQGLFELGFSSIRPDAKFFSVAGTPWGEPGDRWEAGPFYTRQYVVP
jgi:hypothetical protein